MEVWGGNQPAERCFDAAGLRIWIYSRPYGKASGGGDVYYLSSCASGRITRMLLADVSGHGAAVSDVAIGLRDLMRRNVNFIKQTRFIKAMNEQFAWFSEQGGFATSLVSTYFAPTKSFSLSNAGHPSPLVFRRDAREWSTMNHEAHDAAFDIDVPLGIDETASYRELSTKLQPGDMVLSYSDAITESLGGDGRQLGQSGVLELVRSLEAETAGEIIPSIIHRVESFAEDNLEQDDVTLLLCLATGGGPSLKNNLLAPFRMFGPVADRTDFG